MLTQAGDRAGYTTAPLGPDPAQGHSGCSAARTPSVGLRAAFRTETFTNGEPGSGAYRWAPTLTFTNGVQDHVEPPHREFGRCMKGDITLREGARLLAMRTTWMEP